MTSYQTRLGLTFAPSSYQAAIFDRIENGRGHLVVEAVAGSGKTSTILAAAKLIAGDGLFVAFNKSIADLLGQRLRGTTMDASTVHSHGFKAIRAAFGRVRVDAKKYKDMVAGAERRAQTGSLLGQRLDRMQLEAIREDGFPRRACERLIDLARLSLLDLDASEVDFDRALLALASRHDLADWDPCLDSIVCAVVQRCMQNGADLTDCVDFTDMVWLPTVLQLRPRQYSWLFVDECQDISAAARALLTSSIRAGGRMLFVGDRRQAIYGFAGADSESFAAIIDELDADVLPLSVCYRCPTAVLDVAREYCPQIEAREGAPEGAVRKVKRDDYVSEAREGDLVVCRRTAPLLSLCFELISEGVPAVVRGRDIAAGLCAAVKKAAKGRSFSDFRSGLDAWEEHGIDAARARITDADRLGEAIDRVSDKAEAIRVIYARSKATSVAELVRAIEDLFSDDRGSVTLSTVHKAKGLEAERVGILDPSRLMSAWAKQDWQIEQERNLAYVAYTRAMSEIIEIDG